MFHPNVYADGGICLDILQNRWSPTYDVSAILTSIQSLLDEPNPNSPANSVAAQLYQVASTAAKKGEYLWGRAEGHVDGGNSNMVSRFARSTLENTFW